MSIKSHPSNKNYLNNWDNIFGNKKSTKKVAGETDSHLLKRTKKALDKVLENPDLAKNPVIMMAVDHIHDEIEQVLAHETAKIEQEIAKSKKSKNNA